MKDLQQKILHLMEKEIDEELYIFKRYKIISTICLAKLPENITLEKVRSSVRRTDKVFQLNSFYIIFYRYVSSENGVKAFQNLRTKLNLDHLRKEDEKRVELSDFVIHTNNIDKMQFSSVFYEISKNVPTKEVIRLITQELINSTEEIRII